MAVRARSHRAAIRVDHHSGDPAFGDDFIAAQAGLVEIHPRAFDPGAARADGQQVVDLGGAFIIHFDIGQRERGRCFTGE